MANERDQNFSDCVFDDENTIRFVGVYPTIDITLKKNKVGSLLGEKVMYTSFVPDPDNGKPYMINFKKILKTDPDTGEPTTLGEEKPLMVTSFFQKKEGIGRRWWNVGGTKKKRHFRKSKKSKLTKRSRNVRRSRTRRGGRRSRRGATNKKYKKSRKH